MKITMMNMNDVKVGDNIAVLDSDGHGTAHQGQVLEVKSVDLPLICVKWKGTSTSPSMLNVTEYSFKKLDDEMCAAMSA